MHMQIQFGSWWQRLRRGGVLLSPIEQSALAIFRETMPSNFHIAIDAQLKALNLAQRDLDWKGLRLYRKLNAVIRICPSGRLQPTRGAAVDPIRTFTYFRLYFESKLQATAYVAEKTRVSSQW
ncbi:hypothetical protein GCM10027321_08300 [Massilia terrae]|uniref:Uncharacterized protein n=1 Tax=Massilia terrae TaxID=1811224 RepID=A0ABT2D041_9BURK|nr:hypothetical protein [Massilia terrae]MCS0659596.1 hypothetical protein [Massilia terrae]